MVTKGVPSVRSPVCNLQHFNPNVTHDLFADAVIREFQKEYDIDETVGPIFPASF
jgi:lipoate-protein ligase A